MSTNIDKTATFAGAMQLFGFTGTFDETFTGGAIWIGTHTNIESVNPNEFNPVDPSVLIGFQDSSSATLTIPSSLRIPESWAGTTRYINHIFIFDYHTDSGTERGYLNIPIQLNVRALEASDGSGAISLLSAVDNFGNDVTNGVCLENGATTVTMTFATTQTPAADYLFIPVIRRSVDDWEEENVWVKPLVAPETSPDMQQLSSDLIISAPQDFTGGQAVLVLDATKLVLGTYCVGAISKFNNPTPGSAAACLAIDLNWELDISEWNVDRFLISFILDVTTAGLTVLNMSARINVAGYSLNVVFTSGQGEMLVGETTWIDGGVGGSRPSGSGNTYKLSLQVISINTVETVGGRFCAYTAFNLVQDIDIPPEGFVVTNNGIYDQNFVNVYSGITVDTRGDQ